MASPFGILQDISPAGTGVGVGESIAVDDGLVVVGAGSYSESLDRAGSAYVIDASTGMTAYQLFAPVERTGARFGMSVAMNSQSVFVGAGTDSSAATRAGAVYVFDRATGDFAYQLEGTIFGENFGWAMDADETLLAVGAIRIGGFPIPGGGVVELYDPATGSGLGTLSASDGDDLNSFGHSVALSDDMIAVGARSAKIGGVGVGSAYVYDRATMTELGRFSPTDGQSNGRFGDVVAIQGDLLLVGSPFWDQSASVHTSGAAYLFRISTGELLRRFSPPVAEREGKFGCAVAFSDDSMLIGTGDDIRAGSVYSYDLTTFQFNGEFRNLSSIGGFGCAIATEGGLAYLGSGESISRRGTVSVISVEPTCLGDINRDGAVDLGDLNTLLRKFGSTVAAGLYGDIDGSGEIDLADLNTLLMTFGDECSPTG